MRLLAPAIAGILAVQTASPLERGKAIYLTGQPDPASAIVATLADDRDEISASLLPCANCHGADGLGKPEGGVRPPNIRWDTLTKPYPLARPGGRTSPPYTERTLVRAITMGIDPAGNRLDRAMPRYRLSQRDAADLTGYLKTLGTEHDPGVTPSAIRIGVILPPVTIGTTGTAVRRLLTAYFTDLNHAGGIYNRRIEVRFADRSGPDALPRLRAEEPFAIAASSLAGVEDDVGRMASDAGVPVVGAFTLDPRPDAASRIFYTDGGLPGQAETLAAFAAQRQRAGRMVVVHSSAGVSQRAADAAVRAARQAGWSGDAILVRDVGHPRSQLALLVADAVVFVSLDGSAVDFLREAATAAPRAALLVPGPLTSKDIFQLPASLAGRLFVSFPTLPSDRTAAAFAEYERMATAHALSKDSLAEQLAALSAARLLTEALQRAGHELTRQKLVAALESLRDFSTGLTPPITYTPSRRVGVTGAHIVTVDLKSATGIPQSVWVEPR